MEYNRHRLVFHCIFAFLTAPLLVAWATGAPGHAYITSAAIFAAQLIAGAFWPVRVEKSEKS